MNQAAENDDRSSSASRNDTDGRAVHSADRKSKEKNPLQCASSVDGQLGFSSGRREAIVTDQKESAKKVEPQSAERQQR